MREIKRIVLHCTATPQTATIESIKAYWKNTLGWRGVGYHYVVEPSGIIAQLATERDIANGAAGYNADSIHIAYIGGVDANTPIDNRTPEQREALRDLVEKLGRKYPEIEIYGHRELSPDLDGNGQVEPREWIKHCPCCDVAEYIQILHNLRR